MINFVRFKNPVPVSVDDTVSTTFLADGRIRVDVVAPDGRIIDSAESEPAPRDAPQLFLGDQIVAIPLGVRGGQLVQLNPDEFGVIAIDSAPDPNLPEGE